MYIFLPQINWQTLKHQYKIARNPGAALGSELSRIALLLHPYYGHFVDMRSLSSHTGLLRGGFL